MTIPNVVAGAIIDPAWGNAVADHANRHGLVGSAATTTVTTGIVGGTDLPGLSVTFVGLAGRKYLAVGSAPCRQRTIKGLVYLYLTVPGGATGAFASVAADDYATITARSAIFTAVGSTTVKAQGATSGGTVEFGGGNYATLQVFDVGTA